LNSPFAVHFLIDFIAYFFSSLKHNRHQDDFMEFDIQKYGADLWEEWLQHPSNAEFRNAYYDERIGERGRVLLANHVSTMIFAFYFMINLLSLTAGISS